MKHLAFFCWLALIGPCCTAVSEDVSEDSQVQPFYLSEGLFDASQPASLGLEFAENTVTTTVHSPREGGDQFSNGAVLIGFKGHLYAQWQSSKRDEDSADTWVAYSRSSNGKDWSPPSVLEASPIIGYATSGGWWTDGETLVAYINIWPNTLAPIGAYTEYRLSKDGVHWSGPKRVLDKAGKAFLGVFEQDPQALPEGRIVSAFHEPPGLSVAPYFTDDPLGLVGWTRGQMPRLPFNKLTSREIEPSWFYRADGTIVMVFRDQASTFKKLASVSRNRGETWSAPVVTQMPDSRSKQSAGNFPNGTAYLVGNPSSSKSRIPLVVTLSKDGLTFSKAYLLRAGGGDLQPLRFAGRYKRAGYSYPKSLVWNNALYVAYATNKEDVEVTRVPLTSLQWD